MGFVFRWSPTKARKNLEKHGITFEEVATVFRDPLSLTIYDEEHSDKEDRLVILGESAQRRLLVVVHTANEDDIIRIISARVANPYERKTYEEGGTDA
jgi:uncharacterized DUF497 family protein